MNSSSSSPPVLYLCDDDDDDDNDIEQNHYFETNMSLPKVSSSVEMNLPRKKRKLLNTNVCVNPSITNWSKRQRNDHYQPRSSRNKIDSDLDSELILLDPDEYVIEEPESQSYCSFDWTIQSQPLIPTKISSNPIQTISRVSTATNSNVNNSKQRSIDKPNTISMTNTNEKFIQQQKKSIPMPPVRSSLASLLLPSSKTTSSFVQSNIQRGRPMKNSRVSNIQSRSPPSPIRSRPEQSIFAQKKQTSHPPPPPPPPPPALPTSTTSSTSSTNNASPEIRRQLLNGTGIFSAFHDSKYYRCNICKFKSVTSSTLLQHLFTHMFFCKECSFYTYSYFNLSQHIYEKHNSNLIENIHESLNPKSFDLLYVTRCTDGTFALCMDSTTTTNKPSNNGQRRIISSATPTADQYQTKLPIKQNSSQEGNDIVLITENHRSLINSKRKEKQNQMYILMKHRRCYSIKKKSCLHSLTLEYNICREHTIRQMSHTNDYKKRRKPFKIYSNTRLIDEVANCLKMVVNNIVDNEENNNQSSLIQILPNEILSSILSINNLNIITNLLKLNNKYDHYIEQNELLENEYSTRQNHEHIFILSSPEINHSEQSIISSLHSSMTNGDSIFTQTKIEKLPINYDNTDKYLKGNSHNIQTEINNQKKISPKSIPTRPIICKPSRPLSTSLIDRNNNSVISSKSTTTNVPNVIILD